MIRPKLRKVLTLSKKLTIIESIENGKSQSELADELKMAKSSIQKIFTDRKKLRDDYTLLGPKKKKHRKCKFPKTDSALIEWFNSLRTQNVPISGPMIAVKAKMFAESFGEEDFKASNGWVESWRKRHSITFNVISGESGSVNDEVINRWLEDIWPNIQKDYAAKDIFNMDETGLFYKLLPNKTMSRKGEKCSGGKLSKERITVMLCCNSDGTEKLKPLVIGKYENPRCFKAIKKVSLPVQYYFNKKAWMVREIFLTWLRNLDLRMRFQRRKIILLLDNCTAHVIAEEFRNIRLVFFPPNVTSKLQPLDQGIICAMKRKYRVSLLTKIVDHLDKNKTFQVDLLEGIKLLASSWAQVCPQTIANCFRHAKVVHSEETLDDIEDVILEEVDYSVLERLGAGGINIEDYVSVDAQVVTSESLHDEEIIQHYLSDDEDQNDSEIDSEGEDDPEVIRLEIPSNQAVEKYLDQISLWIMSQDTECSESHSSVHQLQDFLAKIKIRSLKQKTISDYFQKV